MEFNRILIIQTAFIGDVVLATPILSKLHQYYPHAKIDFLVRKGNESLLQDDQRLDDILIWDKKVGKNRELFRLIRKIRNRKYDLLVNVQRYSSMGILTLFSGAKIKVGFKKNPVSFGFNRKVSHDIHDNVHEVERNIRLVAEFTDDKQERPSLQLSDQTRKSIEELQHAPYITISPTSVWFTKQLPDEKWVFLMDRLEFEGPIYLLGGPRDFEDCEKIRTQSSRKGVINLCGKLSLLQSAALISKADMNYVNDSAPLHFASSFNAPVTSFFCSTVPSFGFGPLSDVSRVIEVDRELSCRPCGLHGFKACPEGHFKCGNDIDISKILSVNSTID